MDNIYCDAEENEDIYALAEQKIEFGESLKSYIDEHPDIDGLQKLCRKINQELKFLRKVVGKIYIILWFEVVLFL